MTGLKQQHSLTEQTCFENRWSSQFVNFINQHINEQIAEKTADLMQGFLNILCHFPL